MDLTADPGTAAPVQLPTGGGAVRGIGETFTVSAFSGTGSLSVPVATSPGRSGFGPGLALAYDSGFGNGIAGLGWRLELPAISRKTDRGLPVYDDAHESDVFLLSGAEDLVPADVPDQRRGRYLVRRYRPRVESAFARIERWTSTDDASDVFWRTFTGDNVLTRYGTTDESRVRDPADPRRIFSWLICEQQDARGNAVVYGYRPDDALGIDVSGCAERARGPADAPGRAVQRYPKRIRYGNRSSTLDDGGRRRPTLDEAGPDDDGWLFEVVFDYGDHDPARPTPAVQRPWPARADAYSTRRPGFEVRTTRRLRRVLMFHHFPAEDGVGRDCLVRSTDLTYTGEARFSLLSSIAQTGYRRDGDGYLSRAMPPLSLEYSLPDLHDEVHTVPRSELGNLPEGVDGPGYRFADLHGEGVAGVLAVTAEGWTYQSNDSPARPGGVRFGPVALLPSRPGRRLDDRTELLDLAGDGSIDVVSFDPAAAGFWEHDDADGWHPFVAFEQPLNRDVRDPNLRFIDLDGDGRADVLVTEDEALVWHRSLDERGFEAERRRPMPADDDAGPRLVFAGRTESIHLADMTGDGLTDLVRVRNGEISYWPNLGHGVFGPKVTMRDAPRLAPDDLFSPRRVRVTDTDGTGTADLVYVDGDGARLYFNLNGDGWSGEHRVRAAMSGDPAEVSVVDLLGTGTSCLVWSSPLPADTGRQLRYVDLLGGTKPFLLTRVANNLGAETRLRYAPSTRFCVADRLAGRPWKTHVPFPVHVVEHVENLDLVGRNRFASRYAYHDGYFDGPEREFRGFAMVEQWDHFTVGSENEDGASRDGDNENRANLDGDSQDWANLGGDSQYWANLGGETDVPPVYTRAWYHTGAATVLPRPGLPAGLTGDEEREALRALRGVLRRREVYGLDGTPRQDHPYVVTDQQYRVRVLQPRGNRRHAVVHAHQTETLTTHLERDPADPRVEHAFVLEVDDYGLVRQEATVAYGRREPDPGLPADADRQVQGRPLVTWMEHAVTAPIDDADRHPDDYALPRPAENRTAELTGIVPPGGRLAAADLRPDRVAGLAEIPFRQRPDGVVPQRRVIAHTRVLYRPDDLGTAAGDADALLPLGEAGVRAVPGPSLALVLSEDLITGVYVRGGEPLIPDPEVLAAAGYVSSPDGGWWLPTGRGYLSPAADGPEAELRYAARHFMLPLRHRDAMHGDGFDTETTVAFDEYDLLPVAATDAAGDTVRATRLDYRVLKPWQVTDPNGNRTEVAFDVLGLVVATAVRGKPGEHAGDSLDGFAADLDEAALAAFLDDPEAGAADLLAGAGTRIVHDLWAYARAPEERRPAVVATLARERHRSDLADGERSPIQLTFSYCDGFGRVVQAKGQAAGGWVATGWVLLNNQGKPVRRFEPFHTATHRFEFDLRAGVSARVAYDPLGRPIATFHPDGSYEKVVIGTWRLATWDVNDTVLLEPGTDPDVAAHAPPDGPTWYARRIGGELGPHERRAAELAAAHAGTPSVAHADAAGRAFLTVTDNGTDPEGRRELLAVRRELDVDGNELSVRDADDTGDPRGRIAIRHDFDLGGRRIHRWSPDSGDRWLLDDTNGQTILNWDARGHTVRTVYDPARRKVAVRVTGADPADPRREIVTGRIVHGTDAARNLRGRVERRMDQAGVTETVAYDMKGNLLGTTRRLTTCFDRVVDWSGQVELEDDVYRGDSAYDALNRVVVSTRPAAGDRSRAEVRFGYDRSNRVSGVDVRPAPGEGWDALVTEISYNPKGQRLGISYGNGAHTSHEYDPETFRLRRLRTVRPTRRRRVQDLSYTYDPAGNVCHVTDRARQAVFFDNVRVGPDRDYTYDPTYRLIESTGREHLGRSGPSSPLDPRPARLRHAGDGAAMARYTETYRYDRTGNLIELGHRRSSATDPGWTRRFRYDPDGNRLTETTDGTQAPVGYDYDEHGNAISMPHLTGLAWNHHDQLAMTSRQRVTSGTGERTHYVYDGDGRRVRKVTAGADGRVRRECVYLDGVEIEVVHRGRRAGQVRTTLDIADGNRRVALLETRSTPRDADRRVTRYQLGDLLSSCVLELDDRARVLSYEEYGAYGTTTYAAVRRDLESPKRYRYNGKERDAESGLMYYGARYYAVWLARWTSCDPIPLADGTNPYLYARDNPVRFVDPTGAYAKEAVAVATGALTFIGTDIAVPEPTDVVPHKWVGYAVVAVVAVAVIGGVAAYQYFSDDEPAPPVEHPPEVRPPQAPPTTDPPTEIPAPDIPPVIPPAPPVAPPVRPPQAPPIGPVVPPIGPVAPPIAPPIGPAAPPVTDAPPAPDVAPEPKPIPDEKTKPKEATEDPPPVPAPDDEEEPRQPTIRVYRVEVEGTRGHRVTIGTGGTVQIIGEDTQVLWLNFGEARRAEDFARMRLRKGATNVKIKSFDVPLAFYLSLRAIAVEEKDAKRPRANRLRPIMSLDPPRGSQLGLREAHIAVLRTVIIQGTGRQESRP
jgi:RHS repeat-associated protein